MALIGMEYSEIVKALDAGKLVEWLSPTGRWAKPGPAVVWAEIARRDFPPDRYRIVDFEIPTGKYDPPQDPIAVINSLQARIDQLEQQLKLERVAAQANYEAVVNDSVRRLRLHCVIPLYVGAEDFDKVREEVRKSSPLLVGAIENSWHLKNAPVSENAKAALFAAANHGMQRW